MKKFRLRPYNLEDRQSLVGLWNTVFPNPRPHNRAEKIIAEKIAVQPEMLFVAVDDGAVIGGIIAGYDGFRGWLNLVAVDPDRRREGIGKLLVEHAINALAETGCNKVNIQIRQGNEEVIAFYRHLGFEIEPRISMGRFVD